MIFFILPVLTAILIYASLYLSREVWNILDTPTVTPSGAIVGLCEIQGKASTELDQNKQLKHLMLSPVMGVECVWCSVLVEQYTKSGDDEKWEKLYYKEPENGFRIVDGYGGVFVDPTNAKVFLTKSVNESRSDEYIDKAVVYCKAPKADPMQKAINLWQVSPDGNYMFHPVVQKWIPTTYVSEDKQKFYDDVSKSWYFIYQETKTTGFIKGLTNMVDNLTGNKLRVTETIVTSMQDIFVHGYVSFPQDNVFQNELTIGSKGKSKSSYYISSKGEKGPLNSLRLSRAICTAISVVLIVTTVLVFMGRGSRLDASNIIFIGVTLKRWMLPAIFVFITVLIGMVVLKVFRTYNRFVRLRQQVDVSKSTINIVLKRRHELIPQLKNVIDGAAAHEAQLQEASSRLRAMTDEDFMKSVIGLGESYPNLKVNQNFMQLQLELGRSEEKIAMARSFLNDSTLNYNNLRATLFGILFTPFIKKIEHQGL